MNNDKRLAYIILHYGSPYLYYAVKAIYHQVDKILVLYSEKPSQGYATDLPCPDSEQLLCELIKPFNDKIVWRKGNWTTEGQHTDAVFEYEDMHDYEWLIRFDADEIYPAGMISAMIEQIDRLYPGKTFFQLPFIHFWKSFSQVCRDAQRPYRMIRMNDGNGDQILDSCDGRWVIHHMGYCQPNLFILYKLTVQAHKPEFRPNWYEEKWLVNAKKDVHIVSMGMWNVELYDKQLLPSVLKEHPYFWLTEIK